MALDTYDNLKLQIIKWGKRGGVDLLIDDFILLAETEMYNNPKKVLEVRGQEVRSTALTSTTDAFLALPTDYLEDRRLRLDLDNGFSELTYKSPKQLPSSDIVGRPCYYTITSQIEFERVPDQAYTIEIQYFGKPTPLSSSNQTNTVLTDNPNIYLFGSLWALSEYAEEEVNAAKYYTRFINAITGANKNYRKGRYGVAPAMRVEGMTP